MKLGRRIGISHPILKNFRNNLREFLLKAIDDMICQLMDDDISQRSLGDYEAMKTRKENITNLFQNSFTTICRCHDCRATEKDAVFWDNEISEEFYYPPRIGKQRDRRTFWLCPECYENRLNNLKNMREQNYVNLWIWGHQVYLKPMGMKDVHEYLNLPEIRAEIAMNDPEDLTEWEREYYNL